MDGSLDKDGPAIHVLYKPIWDGLVSLKKRGIKIRCITEVTLDNIHYCKKLLEVSEIRHLDGVRTNFEILIENRYYYMVSPIKQTQYLRLF